MERGVFRDGGKCADLRGSKICFYGIKTLRVFADKNAESCQRCAVGPRKRHNLHRLALSEGAAAPLKLPGVAPP